jgi:murein L,D-transpeptidase YcbB/YkuD
LPKPIPVVIFYSTAWSDDGEMHFFRDMYGYDEDLEKTLNNGRPYPQKPMKAVTEKDA